jgi:uncharacterized protein DUF4157
MCLECARAKRQVAPPLVQHALDAPGKPLDAVVRESLQPRFSHDLSRVRIHTGGLAAGSARAINARAYTVGHDIVFGEGAYAPGTTSGKHTLVHELAHVGQQSRAGVYRGAR